MRTPSLPPGYATHPPKRPQDAWPTWMRSSVWPGLVLMLLAFGLLWAFHQVATGIVQQSELRMKTLNTYNHATWRCNSLSPQRARTDCLSRLKVQASTALPDPSVNALAAYQP